jgi:hypothetical protein
MGSSGVWLATLTIKLARNDPKKGKIFESQLGTFPACGGRKNKRKMVGGCPPSFSAYFFCQGAGLKMKPPLERTSESPKISNACGAKAFRKIYYTKGKPLKIESFLHQTATFPTVKPTPLAALL